MVSFNSEESGLKPLPRILVVYTFQPYFAGEEVERER